MMLPNAVTSHLETSRAITRFRVIPNKEMLNADTLYRSIGFDRPGACRLPKQHAIGQQPLRAGRNWPDHGSRD
jgi:hypothetical protein